MSGPSKQINTLATDRAIISSISSVAMSLPLRYFRKLHCSFFDRGDVALDNVFFFFVSVVCFCFFLNLRVQEY